MTKYHDGLAGFLYKTRALETIKRFQTVPASTYTATVASHSYYVALLAMLISDELRKAYDGLNIDYGLMLRVALFHDVDEIISGDIPYNFKNMNFAISDLIKKTVGDARKIVIPREVNYVDLDSNEEDELEFLIVKMADAVDLVMYSRIQVEKLNNKFFDDVLRTSVKILLGITNEISKRNKYFTEFLTAFNHDLLNTEINLVHKLKD